jgi:ectoine hydroxylase-related dioxygenase (phytanoyl-CoA dioxygenase family)
VQTLLLVDDMTLDNGPLQFLPDDAVSLDEQGWLQSRHDDYHDAAPRRHGAFAVDVVGTTVLPTVLPTPTIEPDPRRAITVTGKAGDVVVFGPYAVHGSTPNRSRAPRRVLINGYAAPGANGRRYPGSGLGLRLPR